MRIKTCAIVLVFLFGLTERLPQHTLRLYLSMAVYLEGSGHYLLQGQMLLIFLFGIMLAVDIFQGTLMG